MIRCGEDAELDSEAPIEELEDEDEEDEFELVRAADFFFFFGDHGRSEKPSSSSSEKLSSLPLLIMISLSKSAACVCLGKGARPGSCGGLGSSSNENIADGFLTTETRLSRVRLVDRVNPAEGYRLLSFSPVENP